MKKILLIGIISILGLWSASAGLSDWFFCKITSDEVVISLKKTESFYRCKDTIVSLESLILQTAKDVMTIQTYINKWRDKEYWLGIKKDKNITIEKYQLVRTNIIENMQTFEENLVVRSVQYFILSITPYKFTLQRSLVKVDATSWTLHSSLLSYKNLLNQQLVTIESLSKVKTVHELIPLLNKYIYLKKEILWRYE